MKKIINYFKELLEVLKSIDQRLKTLESCTTYDTCHDHPYKNKVIKITQGWNR